MASQDGQWMLWAKRLKDEHKILLQRIDTATQQIKEIAAGPTDLQSENKSLKERIVRLEEESRDRQRRMLILEEDAVDRKQNMIRQNGDAEDREQVLGNEIQELKGRITELEKVLTRTVENVENSHKPLQILNEVQERQQPERPRLQSHDSVAVASVAFNQEVRIASKAPSQATTTDSGVLIPDAEPDPRNHARNSIGIASQGTESLEAYLKYGDESVMRALQLYETRAVKAFVSGMRDKRRQSLLWDVLTEQGWTWQNAKAGMHMLLDDRRRSKRHGNGGRENLLPQV